VTVTTDEIYHPAGYGFERGKEEAYRPADPALRPVPADVDGLPTSAGIPGSVDDGAGLPGAVRPDRFGAEQSEWEAPDDLVTRLLSAATYMREGFADRVSGELLAPSRGALSPLWQVDAVQLARHAAQAQRFRRTRDVWLAASFGYLIVAGTLTLGLLFTGLLNVIQAILVWVILWVWAYLLAVVLVFRQARAARHAAVAVIYEPEAAVPPPLARPSVEQGLADLNRTNAVLFRGESSPFVGSGVNVDSWHLTLDVSKRVMPEHGRRAMDPDGKVAARAPAPKPITGADLQEALLETMPQRISPRPSSGNRLYVRGGSNALSVPLFRIGPIEKDPIEAINFRRPVTRIPEDRVRQYLHEPTEAARVYTYFEHSAWGGQVVVTLFVRAFVSNQTMFVEGLVYALRPLQRQFYAVRGLPVDRRTEVSSLLSAAFAEALPLLVAAPGQVVSTLLAGRVARSRLASTEAEIERRRDIDFGARSSLREQVANYNLGDSFAAADEQMFYQIFNRRAMECIGLFLENNGVDLAEFNGQAGSIIGGTTSKAASIYGAAVDNGITSTDGGDYE
jgi:hypothetical protein